MANVDPNLTGGLNVRLAPREARRLERALVRARRDESGLSRAALVRRVLRLGLDTLETVDAKLAQDARR